MPGSGKRAKPLHREELLAYAVRALSARAYSIGALRQKLRTRAAVESDIEEVLSTLKQARALNDRVYAEGFSNARKSNQGFGQARVMRELLVRKVPPTVAKEAVREAYAGEDELLLVEQFLERKYRGKDLAQFLKDERNLASAYRRLRTAGFSAASSVRVLKRYASRAEELPEEDGEESIDSGPGDGI